MQAAVCTVCVNPLVDVFSSDSSGLSWANKSVGDTICWLELEQFKFTATQMV